MQEQFAAGRRRGLAGGPSGLNPGCRRTGLAL